MSSDRKVAEHDEDLHTLLVHSILRLRKDLDRESFLQLNEADFEIRQRWRYSSLGLKQFQIWLSVYKDEVEKSNYLCEDHLDLFSQRFGLENQSIMMILKVNHDIAHESQREKVPILKSQLLQLMTVCMLFWEVQGKLADLKEQELGRVRVLALGAPDKKAMDSLVRYIASLDRGYYRAARELKHDQRRRRRESNRNQGEIGDARGSIEARRPH